MIIYDDDDVADDVGFGRRVRYGGANGRTRRAGTGKNLRPLDASLHLVIHCTYSLSMSLAESRRMTGGFDIAVVCYAV